MEPLRAGQESPLAGDRLALRVRWRTGPLDLDVSALLLNAAGKVRSDADFVFYNQPATPDGSVRHTGKSSADMTTTDGVDLDLVAIPSDVDSVRIAASVDGGTFSDLGDLHVVATTTGQPTGIELTPYSSEGSALVCADIYRYDGGWRLRATQRNYHDGLAGFARDGGVDID